LPDPQFPYVPKDEDIILAKDTVKGITELVIKSRFLDLTNPNEPTLVLHTEYKE
jgi:hypothetical protein